MSRKNGEIPPGVQYGIRFKITHRMCVNHRLANFGVVTVSPNIDNIRYGLNAVTFITNPLMTVVQSSGLTWVYVAKRTPLQSVNVSSVQLA